MRSGAPVSARELSVAEVADLLELTKAKPGQPKPTKKAATQRARRILEREGIARRHGPRGWYYTTEADLRRVMPHVWATAVARRMGVG
jgi:hypothetical protein